jgi:glycerol-3-phosphate responsive antiterminator
LRSVSLPRVLVASNGRDLPGSPGPDTGVLLRDLDLETLADVAGMGMPRMAVDMDSVGGLNADASAVRFVTRRLGIGIVMSRRPAVVARVAELGCLALLRIFAFDSTGLGRSLDGHPRHEGIGTVISPGPVLAHLSAEDLDRLPRPLVAYGLVDTPARALALLRQADAVVISAECAMDLAAASRATAGAGPRAAPPQAPAPRPQNSLDSRVREDYNIVSLNLRD